MAFDDDSQPSIGAVPLGGGRFLSAEDVVDLLRRPAWMRDAACRAHPEVNFYPGIGASLKPARAVCGVCLVHDECLGYALEHDEYGVWGGLSRRERRMYGGLRPAS